MRNIKFRAWDKVSKTMYTDAVNNCKDSFDMILKHPQVYEVMQYTGLKDKDGVEIYEGDILGNEKISTKWEVGFNRGAFVLTNKDVDMGVLHNCSAINGKLVGLKILGNIYNTELLNS
jgi:uncharacterized phage protein (TIGR01671 family)